jgi:putative tricarboxylic transport membrane protein
MVLGGNGMTVLDALWAGLAGVLSWPAFGLMLLTIPIGLIFGIIPGMGGNMGLALLIPFTFGMQPIAGFAFLLGMHAVVHTGGSIPAILFDTPGTGPNAATCIEGFPMAQKGEAGRALGAALMSSMLGGVLGAIFLALVIPVVRPLVLSFGPPEFFMLAIMGLAFISLMSGDSILRGLMAGGMGLIISFVGMDPQTGVVRFSFGVLHLMEGINIVTIVVGLFALAEVIDMGVKGGAIAHTKSATIKGTGVLQGIKDCFTHWWLVMRCSVIGNIIGIIPGLGGDAAAFICYGHAVQTSKHKEEFGKGCVEGVIATDSAHNSKEGGALVPTLAFGVPGSSGMAILLGAFLILGVAPGKEMFTTHLDLVFSMVWVIVIANILAVAICLPLAGTMSKVTFIRTSVMIPYILVCGILGSYLTTANIGDVLITVLFGFIGFAMKKYDYARGPLILGIVLGKIAENALSISLNLYGLMFIFRPIAFVILIITLGTVLFPAYKERAKKKKLEEVSR